MITTKHDLCANTAKLNLNELIEVARIATARCRWDCEQSLGALQERQSTVNPDKWRHSYHIAASACDLADSAKALATATNTLHYLLNAEDREIVLIDKK